MLLPAVDVPGADLPVRAVLADLTAGLAQAGAAVLVAPPGTGKTTLVPLALADTVPGRIIVAEPRRVAVRAAARRMASLVGGEVGGIVGYRVRGDTKVSSATRIEVVTTGVLVRQLQRDPELPGVDVIVVDECHERQLDTDLALAFTVDVRANLRDDLRVLATSATAQADRIAAALGPGTPVVTADADTHPVELRWHPPTRPVAAPHGLRVDPKFLDHVGYTAARAVRDTIGDVLVFLPGSR
ncbi:MAG: DEAD/DEAH box helicase, partial [Stackebrandtia sp.]